MAHADIDDPAAVGRDLHVVGVFELEHVDGMQAARLGQVGRQAGERKGDQRRPQRGSGDAIHRESLGRNLRLL
jgi:hypothetical protein